jgi:uncharacterized protein (TIGR03546 family)
MFTLLLRPLRFLAQALTANDSPRQFAAGFALGVMVGLLPKGNLLAIGLAMLLCAVKVNKAAGLVAIGVFSFAGWLLDGFAHKLGAAALTWEPARDAFTTLYNMPLGPFIGLNNTVVMGQFLIGLYLLYPTYKLSHAAAVRYQPRIMKWLMSYRIIRWLRGAELGAQWGLES